MYARSQGQKGIKSQTAYTCNVALTVGVLIRNVFAPNQDKTAKVHELQFAVTVTAVTERVQLTRIWCVWRDLYQAPNHFIMSPAKATLYSFASWQNRHFGFFFGPSSVKKGRTHIVLGLNMQCVMLLECPHYSVVRQRYFSVTTLKDLFETVKTHTILDFIFKKWFLQSCLTQFILFCIVANYFSL